MLQLPEIEAQLFVSLTVFKSSKNSIVREMLFAKIFKIKRRCKIVL